MLENINTTSKGDSLNDKLERYQTYGDSEHTGVDNIRNKIKHSETERVKKCLYEGTIIKKYNNHIFEINRRIEIVRAVFITMKCLVTNRNLKFEI